MERYYCISITPRMLHNINNMIHTGHGQLINVIIGFIPIFIKSCALKFSLFFKTQHFIMFLLKLSIYFITMSQIIICGRLLYLYISIFVLTS